MLKNRASGARYLSMRNSRYLIVVGALAAVAGLMFLYKGKDWLVQSALVQAVESATGVSVGLGSLRIELTQGDGFIKDFRMGNPKGFSRDELLTVGTGKVTLDIGSVTGSVIRIKTAQMEKVSILFEGSGKKNNMNALEAQVNERSARPEETKETKSKKYRIDSFILKDVKLDVRMPGIGKIGKLDLGDIRISNLGGQNGATASEIAGRISNEISSRAKTAVINNMVKLAEQMGMDVSNIADGLGLPTGVLNDAAGFLQNLFK